MKTYLYTHARAVAIQQPSHTRKALFLLFSTLISFVAFAQPGGNSSRLDFKNPVLISGVAGADDAIYNFEKVDNQRDAHVRIVRRSDELVALVDVDVPDMGYDKAFQPKVMYNGGTTPAGLSDWWMEFEITFVQTGTSLPADKFDTELSAIDIDGNGQYIRENVHFYGLKSYRLETGSLLEMTNLFEVLGLMNALVGKRFDGPTVNFLNIDTSGTAVMTTANYEQVNSMRVRVGGVSSDASAASDRMYSLFFKPFSFNQGLEFTLPLVLKTFNASLHSKKVALDWVTGHEKDLSHFVIERSTNGIDYSEAAIVFAAGNSTAVQKYAFTDAVSTASKGVIYYRLKMMDSQKRFQYSAVRIVRFGDVTAEVQVQAYPNPVINELRVTIPASWQNKQVSYEVYNANGNLVKRISNANASQTETLSVTELGKGSYIVKAFTQSETASQRIVKM